MEYILLAFLAGILTVLSPCVLPVLPIVIGGSLTDHKPLRPFIITASLAVSIVVFTLLLKVSTLVIHIPQTVWSFISGFIILFFGILSLWPHIWTTLSLKLGFENKSHDLLAKAGTRKGLWGDILLGAALGPVFASCSPVYFLILATILPVHFLIGVLNLVVYALGLSLILFLIAFFGQKIVLRLRWAANPNGWFRKFLGVLFLVVGVLILTGADKTLESWVLDHGFNFTVFEEQLIDFFDS
jgi:cytochrome c-type biogenesis protein